MRRHTKKRLEAKSMINMLGLHYFIENIPELKSLDDKIINFFRYCEKEEVILPKKQPLHQRLMNLLNF